MIANGNQVRNGKIVDGICVDSNGDPLGNVDNSIVFPNGFETFQLKQGFENPTFTDLKPLITNNAEFVGVTKRFQLSLSNRFRSGFYSLILKANDINGFPVSGSSPIFAIKNTEPLPPLSSLYFT